MSGLLSEKYIDCYKSLSSPVRLKILLLLLNYNLDVTNLSKKLNVKQPNISQHLLKLKRNQLVNCTKLGKKRIYVVTEFGKKFLSYLVNMKL